jgi:phosphoglycerol transferase MdoB-like AlkP superfamily enzyme
MKYIIAVFIHWLKYLCLLLGLYLCCRISFIFCNSAEFKFSDFSSISSIFFSGLRFDISAILATNLVFTVLFFLPLKLHHFAWYHSALKLIFLSVNCVFILLNIADIAYYPFIQKRIQSDALLFVSGDKGSELLGLIPVFLMQYWYLCIFFLIALTILIKGYQYMEKSAANIYKLNSGYGLRIVLFVFLITLNIIGMRGGLQLRPIDVINASESVGVTNAPIVMNSTFSLLWTIQKKAFKAHPIDSYLQLDPCDKGIHLSAENGQMINTKTNVVIIAVESLSKQYISAYGGTGRTPFLDSLISVSHTFTNAFANGRESVQGIPAILASIPSWMDEPFIFSRYASNRVNSLASVLKANGYHTSFFHGASKGTMGFHSFTKHIGFDDYISKETYNKMQDYDGSWGIWDEPFLQYMADRLSVTEQPFLSAILTLNSHHPFRLPEKYKNKFKTKGHPILSSIRYVDYALQQFFHRIKNEPWFENTLFVITADHTGPNTDVLKTKLDEYRIPIIFYHPGKLSPMKSDRIASQIDIFPSVLHSIGMQSNFFSLGNNLFSTECSPLSINYTMSVYQCMDSTYFLQYNSVESIGLYNWKKDRLLQSNLVNAPAVKVHQAAMEKSFKNKILSYQFVLQNNKMSINPTNEIR